jgi:WD40 repeat protein
MVSGICSSLRGPGFSMQPIVGSDPSAKGYSPMVRRIARILLVTSMICLVCAAFRCTENAISDEPPPLDPEATPRTTTVNAGENKEKSIKPEGVNNPQRPEPVLQIGHSGSILGAAFTADGHYLLTSDGSTARLWETPTGRLVRAFRGSPAAITADGRYVLSGSVDLTATLWDAATGAPLHTFKSAEQFTAFAFTPDGQHALAASDKVAVLDIPSCAEVRTLELPKCLPGALAITSDGQRVLVDTSGSEVMLCDFKSGELLRKFRCGRYSHCAAISPDGKRIITTDGQPIVWDANTGEELRTLKGHQASVFSGTFSPDGRRIVTGSMDKTAILWDAATGEQLRKFEGHESDVMPVGFTPDGKQILTASYVTIRLWDAASGKKLRTFAGPPDTYFSAGFSRDGRQLATGAWKGGIVVWNGCETPSVRMMHAPDERVEAVAFSRNGQQLLTGGRSGAVISWDTTTGKKALQFDGHSSDVRSAAVSPDGKLAITGSEDGTAILWDCATAKKVRTFHGPLFALRKGGCNSVAFSFDGKQALGGFSSGSAMLWDIGTGNNVASYFGPFCVISVAISNDGKQLLLGDPEGNAFLEDTATRRIVRVLKSGERNWLAFVAFSPDGKRLFTAGEGATAIVWDSSSGQKIRTITAPETGFQRAALSPDGNRLLTTLYNGTAILWDTSTGDQLAQLVNWHETDDWLVFTPDGRYDGSEQGRKLIAFRTDGALNVVPAEAFPENYRPGLLSTILRGAPLPPNNQNAKPPSR